jgi:hypothetical protein
LCGGKNTTSNSRITIRNSVLFFSVNAIISFSLLLLLVLLTFDDAVEDNDDDDELFILYTIILYNLVHYTVQSDKPNKKFIELKRLSGEFSYVDKIGSDSISLYVDKIGSDSISLYVPVLELEASSFNFP